MIIRQFFLNFQIELNWKYYSSHTGIKRLSENKKLATGAGQIFTDYIIIVLKINTNVEICINIIINIRV